LINSDQYMQTDEWCVHNRLVNANFKVKFKKTPDIIMVRTVTIFFVHISKIRFCHEHLCCRVYTIFLNKCQNWQDQLVSYAAGFQKFCFPQASFTCFFIEHIMYMITKICNRVSLGNETVCLLQLICLIVASEVTSFEDFNTINFS
jgi:hypothetical protein